MEQNQKELLLSGGAGALAFQMGYLHVLTQIIGVEKLKEYKIGGISAGSAVGAFFHLSLYMKDYDLKYFYQNKIRKFFEKENKKYYGFFTSGNLMEQFCNEYWDLIEENKDIVPHVNGVLHTYVAQVDGIFKLKKVLVDHFEDKDNFREALISSGMIPFISRPTFFNIYKGKKCLDGGLVQVVPYKNQDSYKIFINVLPKFTRQWPAVTEEIKNIEYLDITENYNIRFPIDYWIWDEFWCDEMFAKGQMAAQNEKDRLIKIFI